MGVAVNQPPYIPPYTGGQEGGLWLACQLQGYRSRQRRVALKPAPYRLAVGAG